MSAVEPTPAMKPLCEHYWAWVSPAGTSRSARLCMFCHEPDADWLNTITEDVDIERVRADAWDEGVSAGFSGMVTRQNALDVKRSNPYRTAPEVDG